MLRKLWVATTMALFTTSMFAGVKVDKTEYKGCYRVSNGEIELIVTGVVGPRVIRFGFAGGRNMFKEFPEQRGRTGENKFQLRGGTGSGRLLKIRWRLGHRTTFRSQSR